MSMKTIIRNAFSRLRRALKPAPARHVDELTMEIRLDTQRIMFESQSQEIPAAPVAEPSRKKKDPTGPFRAHPA